MTKGFETMGFLTPLRITRAAQNLSLIWIWRLIFSKVFVLYTSPKYPEISNRTSSFRLKNWQGGATAKKFTMLQSTEVEPRKANWVNTPKTWIEYFRQDINIFGSPFTWITKNEEKLKRKTKDIRDWPKRNWFGFYLLLPHTRIIDIDLWPENV